MNLTSKITLASYITCLRIILIVPIIYLSYFKLSLFNYFAFALFIIAGLTDYLDGYVARKTNTVSSLGALLDLLADKLLICVILIWLIFLIPSVWFTIPALVIISRELIIASLRQFIVEKRGESELIISFTAKSKTTVQIIAIGMVLIAPELGQGFYLFSVAFVWFAAFLSLYSLFSYISEWSKHYLK